MSVISEQQIVVDKFAETKAGTVEAGESPAETDPNGAIIVSEPGSILIIGLGLLFISLLRRLRL